ncbi:MAG: 50S ribosomal protein L29 [Bryobacteraceae bacterium]
MKAEKIRGIDAADLTRQVQNAQEQLFRFRFQMGMGQNEGLKKYRALKKDRARMLTVLREMGVTVVAPAAAAAKVAGRKPAAKTKRGLGGLFRKKK